MIQGIFIETWKDITNNTLKAEQMNPEINENLQKVHKWIGEHNERFNVPLERFAIDMQDTNNRKKVHKWLGDHNERFNVPYDVFSTDMGFYPDNMVVTSMPASELYGQHNPLFDTFEAFRADPDKMRVSSNPYDRQPLLPEAYEYLDSHQVETQRFIPNQYGGGMYVPEKARDKQLESQWRDFLANTTEGQQAVKRSTAFLDSLQQQLDALEQLNRQRFLDIRKQHAGNDQAVLQGMAWAPAGGAAYMPALPSDEALKPVAVQARRLEEARKALEAYKDAQSRGALGQFTGEFSRGFLPMLEDIATFGLSGLGETLDEKAIFDKQAAGQPLTPDEQLYLQSAALSQAIQSYTAPTRTVPQDVASAVEGSIPFMVSFGTLGAPAKAATKGAVSAAKRGIVNQARNGMSRTLARTLGAGVDVADASVRSAAMSFIDPRTYDQAMQYAGGEAGFDVDPLTGQVVYTGQQGSLPLGEALGKAVAGSIIENVSEHSGAAFGAVGRGLKNFTSAHAPELAKRLWQNQGAFRQSMQKIMQSAGWNGTVEEFLEEQVSTMLNAMFTGEAQWSDLLDPRQQLVTFLTVAAIGSGASMVGSAGQHALNSIARQQYRSAVNDFDKQFAATPDKAEPLKTAMASGTIEETQAAFVATLSDPTLSPGQRKAVVNYFARGMQQLAANGAKQQEMQQAEAQAQQVVGNLTQGGTQPVITAEVEGRTQPVRITGGLAFNHDGTPDLQHSDQEVFYIDEEGRTQVASPSQVIRVVEHLTPEEAAQQAAGQIVAPVAARQADEEAPAHQPGEEVLFSLDGTGQAYMQGIVQGVNPDGSYAVTDPAQGVTFAVRPSMILDVSPLQGVELGMEVDYRDRQGNVRTATLNGVDGYIQRGLLYVGNETIPVQDLIGPHREASPSPSEGGDVSSSSTEGEETAMAQITLSDEVDENGRQFVLTPEGNLEFGVIDENSGLTPAPILLSEGIITNPATNDGYV